MVAITPPPDAVGRLVAAPTLRALAGELDRARSAAVSGLWGSSVGAVLASIHRVLEGPVLLVCGHLDEADDLAEDLALFTGRRPEVLPALELSGSLGRGTEELVANRLQLVRRLAEAQSQVDLIVAPVQALMQAMPSRKQLTDLFRIVEVGQQLEPEKLIVWLSEHGYNRLEQVEVPGDFAVRGGIVDIYVPGDHAEAPEQVGLTIRIDFFDDRVESIRRFSPETMGSTTPLQRATLLDVRGKQPDVADSTSLFAYLPEGAIVAFWAPLEIQEQSKSYQDRLPEEIKGIYPLSALLRLALQPKYRVIEMSPFEGGGVLVGKDAPRVRVPIGSLAKFETDSKKAIAELAELAGTHDVAVLCENDGERTRFAELLEQHRTGLSAQIATPVGYIHHGFTYAPEAGRPLAIVGHHELFHRYEQRRRVRKVIASRPVDSFLDLKVGDYVVHVAHGIAKFTGIQTLTKEGKTEEYLTLRFADDAALHVPATRINLIQKYIGGFTGHPQLSRLGSGLWEKQKAKVADAVMDMAAELIEVQAARAAQLGVAFPPDTAWQKEFEAEFPYEPTADQLTGAQAIKDDMCQPRPMDRLLCGDVGYGKTELAMRAAFKAVEHGKQVAVLVPTTVLSEQHERSFRERMANYPFRVESVSRFKTPKQVKETLRQTAAGEVDVLIGTHRLLSKDVRFADLGLVVVDEEQRFGVTHKERLKQMRKTVDVLTMSATPIPRTLHMSMLGLRDISSLTTAPQDRRSVVTEVMSYDAQRVKMALRRELEREGQVYFVHNRVHSIIERADEVQRLVPEARILIGHGQMGEGELEEVMLKFIRHEADILVCTTIIESGLDIGNANTMVIDQADRFGLSELHQLRGRVGRYKHRAYCYLLLPADRPVTPIAQKRLKAIEEYSHLGAGFKIAMRDLELRGAGNILGPEQSGHIAAVGYEMYCQLLEEATRQLKNQPRPPAPDAHVEIGVTAMIPRTYVAGDRQRMDLYRRMTRCSSVEMLRELVADTVDAFGEAPRQAVVLFALTELRLLAGHFGVESVIKQDPDVVLKVHDAAKAQAGLKGCPGTVRVIDEKTIYLRMPAVFNEPETLLMTLRNLLKNAYDREKNPAAVPTPTPADTTPPPAATATPAPRQPPNGKPHAAQPQPPKPVPPPAAAKPANADYDKLLSLRTLGVLTEAEFQAAAMRLLAKAKKSG